MYIYVYIHSCIHTYIHILSLSLCTHSVTANVCRVRTLRRMTMTYPGNALLWSNLGGMVMTPDGSAIIAGDKRTC